MSVTARFPTNSLAQSCSQRSCVYHMACTNTHDSTATVFLQLVLLEARTIACMVKLDGYSEVNIANGKVQHSMDDMHNRFQLS